MQGVAAAAAAAAVVVAAVAAVAVVEVAAVAVVEVVVSTTMMHLGVDFHGRRKGRTRACRRRHCYEYGA